MQLKANLHFHSAEDPVDRISYSLREGIDHAASLGFRALAVTCHMFAAWSEEAADYARSKGTLLIPGIELSLHERFAGGDPVPHGKHALLLNATKDAEAIRTFRDLEIYKRAHPNCFVIAPHPYYYRSISLNGLLEKYLPLFDAVEHSWFYSKLFNYNDKAIRLAREKGLPLISTSDTHYLDFMDDNYVVVNAEEQSVEAFFSSLRKGDFEMVTSPQATVPMLYRQTLQEFRSRFGFLSRS